MRNGCKNRMLAFLMLIGLFSLTSCERSVGDTKNRLVDIAELVPESFDSLPKIPDNNILTTARVKLGKKLFFDKRLSADGSVSCGSCHKKANAYADNNVTTQGAHGIKNPRNVPTLINVAYQKRMFMEGGVPDLETQVLSPFTSRGELDLSINAALTRIHSDSTYQSLAQKAYGDTLDAYMIAKAIASFERTLLSTGSAYDRYLSGDTAALNTGAKNGMRLFFSERTKCSSCHAGFLFTDQKYYNIGLNPISNDEGRARITLDSADLGKFKTPTLRNVSLTAPYMHDGSLRTLFDVINHYNTGGADHPNKDPRIDSLGLSKGEINALILFLNSLTDSQMPG